MKQGDPNPAHAVEELAARVLLESHDSADAEQLGRALAGSAAARKRFLDHTTVQTFLVEEAKAGSFAPDRSALFAMIDEAGGATRRPRPLRWISAAAAVLTAGLLIVLGLNLPGRADAAMESLEKVIAAFSRFDDRSYVIHVLDDGGWQRGGSSRERNPGAGRYPPIAHLDGARLHLRGGKQFVLVQSLPNGERRIMGGDGVRSWSFRGKGPVRVSDDPRRFRGGLPGGRQDLAFLDLRSQLDGLKSLYKLRILEPSNDRPSSEPLRGLHGTRHSRQQGGPKEIEIWFGRDSGTIHRMVLAGLPHDRGGPRRVALKLESTAPLRPDFFGHEAHHEPGRPIEPEPDRKR